MKMKTGTLVTIAAVMVILVFSAAGGADASDMKLQRLTKDTVLEIPFTKAKVTFAAGTLVKYDMSGAATRGFLAQDTPLIVPGLDKPVVFKKKTEIEFSMMGKVSKGTPVSDAVYPIECSRKPIKLKGNAFVGFGSSGVQYGTLAERTKLPNPKNKNIEEFFPAGSYVMFTITGGLYMVTPPVK